MLALENRLHAVLAARMINLAVGGSWGMLMTMLPLGVALGAVHAATSGHGKGILAGDLTGSPLPALRAAAVALVQAATHVGTAIGGLALPLVTRTLGGAGRALSLEAHNRGVLVAVGTAVTAEIVRPQEGRKGFAKQPRRWIVERTFGWLTRCRRLNRDHGSTLSSALASFVLAAAMILARRLARVL